MISRGQLEAFQRSLVAASGAFGKQASAALVVAARQERQRVLKEQTQRSGTTPTDVVIPDGRRDAPLESAQRVVVIEYGYLREIVLTFLWYAIANVPKRSGRYAASFIIIADGAQISSVDQITHETKDIVIVNTEPYARRLEVGKKKDGTPFVINASDALAIKRATLEAARRYGNIAFIKHEYFDLDGAYTLKKGTTGGWKEYAQDRRSSGHRAGRAGRFVGGSKAGRAIRYPGARIRPL